MKAQSVGGGWSGVAMGYPLVFLKLIYMANLRGGGRAGGIHICLGLINSYTTIEIPAHHWMAPYMMELEQLPISFRGCPP